MIDPAARRSNHALRAAAFDPRRPYLDAAQGLADRQRRAIPAREVRLAVAGVNGVCDHAGLSALEVAGVDPVMHELRQRMTKRLVEHFERYARRRRHVDDEPALVNRPAG